MSGAAAVASARRRRGVPQPQPQAQAQAQVQGQVQSQSQVQGQVQGQGQGYSPIQILQLHSLKIKELETSMEQKIEDAIVRILENRDQNGMTQNGMTQNGMGQENPFILTQLQSNVERLNKLEGEISYLTKSYDDAKGDLKELHKNHISEENIVNTLNIKIELFMTNRMASINETIKILASSIDTLSDLPNIYDLYTRKIDGLIAELNDLKTIVLKSQSLGLETNSEILQIKNEMESIKTTIDNDRDSDNDNFGMNGQNSINDKNTNLLFQTLFSKMDNFSKINIHDDDDECDECEVNSINEIDNTNNNLTIEDGTIEDENELGPIEIDEIDKGTIDLANGDENLEIKTPIEVE